MSDIVSASEVPAPEVPASELFVSPQPPVTPAGPTLESLHAQIQTQAAEIEALKAPKVAVGAPKTLPFGIYAGAPQFLTAASNSGLANFGSPQTQFVVAPDASPGLIQSAANLAKFNYDQAANAENPPPLPPAGIWVGTTFTPVTDILP